MTDSHTEALSASRGNRHLEQTPHQRRNRHTSVSTRNSLRRAGSASRTFGRYPVSLRPILDPKPYLDPPQTAAEKPRRRSTMRQLET
jgi:hypothetical protein